MTILFKVAFLFVFLVVINTLLPSSIFQSMGIPLLQIETFVREMAQNISALTPWLDLVFHAEILFTFMTGLLYFGFVYLNFRLMMFVFNLLK